MIACLIVLALRVWQAWLPVVGAIAAPAQFSAEPCRSRRNRLAASQPAAVPTAFPAGRAA